MGNWWGNVYDPLPQSTKAEVLTPTEDILAPGDMDCSGGQWFDFCSVTGGIGPAWHFDGTHLFVRIVNTACYNTNTKNDCTTGFFDYNGVKVLDIYSPFSYNIEATCSGCTSHSTSTGIVFFNVTDSVPSAFSSTAGSIVPTLSGHAGGMLDASCPAPSTGSPAPSPSGSSTVTSGKPNQTSSATAL